LVVGVGTIGLFMIAGLRAVGARRIVAVGRSPGRRRVASQFGADIVLDARASDLLGQLRQLDIEFGSAFECSGAPDMMLAVAPVMGIGATIVEVALPAEPGQVNLRTLVDKALRIVGSCAFAPSDYERALDLLLRGVVDAAPVVSERVSLGDAPNAFERLRDPGELVGVLVEPWR
jgi:threonine dehydrogenase-like Zn-dependent dehydrogenase